MIDRRWLSTTACGYVDKSKKVIHNLDRQTTSPSEVSYITRYLNAQTTSSGEVPRQMIHLDGVGCQTVCHIDLTPGLYNANGATFGATFLQRSYDRERSYEL